MNWIRRVKPQLNDDSDVTDHDYKSLAHTRNPESPSENDDEQMNDGGSKSEPESEDEVDQKDSTHKITSQIPFASLVKAQASLAQDRRKSSTSNLITTRETPAAYFNGSQKQDKKKEKHSRSSKNAPQEISSKRAVTRKREVVEPTTHQKARDPRFDTAVNGRYDEHEFRKNYSFLDDYRNDEMKTLKEEMKKMKDERMSEQIVKKLKSMESQEQSQQNKDKVQEVIKEHKKKERELVKHGKKPYYLTKSDIKKRVLEKQFSQYSEKQLENAIARKQKRKTQKERKNMPWERREA